MSLFISLNPTIHLLTIFVHRLLMEQIELKDFIKENALTNSNGGGIIQFVEVLRIEVKRADCLTEDDSCCTSSLRRHGTAGKNSHLCGT